MRANVEDMKGETFRKVERVGDDLIRFWNEDGSRYDMFHDQDCCECVEIKDIIGDLECLEGSPITMAECRTEEGESEHISATYTFYKFATERGYVTIDWCGESNGYYSEEVDIEYIPPHKVALQNCNDAIDLLSRKIAECPVNPTRERELLSMLHRMAIKERNTLSCI